MTDHRPSALPRLAAPHLPLRRIRDALDRHAPITVLRGLQGYGRSTQVASWLIAQGDSVVALWVDVGPSTTPAEVRELVGEQVIGWRSDRSLAVNFARLSRDRPITLTFSGAEHLDDPDLLRDLVEATLRQPALSVVVIGRGRHPIETAGLGIVEIVGVPAHDLLLSAGEVQTLGRLLGVGVTADQAARIREVLGGWAAAVRLVLEDMRCAPGQIPLARAQEYLREVVLPGILDRPTLQLVRRFALADRLTHSLVTELAGDADPQRLVADLEATGLADRYYVGDDVELVFPSFIRSALHDDFAMHDPDGLRDMHAQLARWYATHGEMVLALEHAVAGRDWDALDEIWATRSLGVGVQGAALLQPVLRDLPADVLDTRPGLRAAQRLSRLAAVTGGPDDGRAGDGGMGRLQYFIEAAVVTADVRLDELSLPDLLFIGTTRMIGLRLVGDIEGSVELADEVAERTAPLLRAETQGGELLAWFQLQRGLTETLLGRTACAVRWYQDSWYQRGDTLTWVQANAAANLALTAALRGEFLLATQWRAKSAMIDISSHWNSELMQVGSHVAAGLLALDRLDDEDARAELDRLGDGSNFVELWPFVAYLAASHGLHFADPEAASSAIETAIANHPAHQVNAPGAFVVLTRARVDLLTACGRMDQAEQLLADPRTQAHSMTAVPLARLALLRNDADQAEQIAMTSLSRPGVPPRTRLQLFLLAAQAAQRSGSNERARVAMGHALALYRRTNMLRAFATIDVRERARLLGLVDQRLDPEALATLAAHRSPFTAAPGNVVLTKRERQLAAELRRSSSRQAIADTFYVSVNTVRSQLGTLYRKLGVNTREQALTRLDELDLG